ncbi:S24/S26 family peptidase [Paenibacillus sp. TSA_86.1]|uniref:S24/S26 family peptidase n=1 Tax=Paenibacillus sp. TSA_86.1 TaxID=3415649 RepID=UPI004046658D
MLSTRRQDFLIHALQQGKSIPIVIDGNCMYPLLVQGQRVAVHPLLEEIKEGDVVLVRDQMNGFLAHRIISLGHDFVVTAGDRNHLSDPPVRRDDILGRLDIPEDPMLHQNPDQNPDERHPTLAHSHGSSSEMKVVVHPEAMGTSHGEVLSRAFGVDIIIAENPFSQLISMREKGWISVVIHEGARQHLSQLPHAASSVVIFAGYEVARDRDESAGIIGMSDVDFVARTATQYWNNLHAELSIAAIIGFHMRGTSICHG